MSQSLCKYTLCFFYIQDPFNLGSLFYALDVRRSGYGQTSCKQTMHNHPGRGL